MPAPLNAAFALTVYSSEFLVSVGWAWLAVSLGLLVVAQVLLVATISRDVEADGATAGES